MFGYVKPRKSELLVREYGEYKSIYCSLCRQLGKRYGVPARLALNYDCTFYVLVLMSVSPAKCPDFMEGRCVVNPLKKCAYCRTEENEKEFAAASALTVILTYYKLRDDTNDSKFWKKVICGIAYPFLAFSHKKAARDFPHIDEIVAQTMVCQAKIESQKEPGLDLCAQPTAEMLERIFESAVGEPGLQTPLSRIFRQLGYNLGRWIYLIDAADDIKEDIASNSFNPFIIKFKLDNESSETDLSSAKEYANQVLNMTLSQLNAAVDLLDFNCLGSIVKNVVFQGLPEVQKELLFEKEKVNVGSV